MDKPTGNAQSRRVSGWVKAFVLFHLVCVTLWTFPQSPEGVRQGRVPPTPYESFLVMNDMYTRQGIPRLYLGSLGIWQYWDMFAPNPLYKDFHGDAVITYEDGSEEVWKLPRVADMPIGEKVLGERFRKYFDRVHLEDSRRMWPSLAQGVAVEVALARGKVPKIVFLRRYHRDLPRPNQTASPDFQVFPFFKHFVNREKVSRLSGRPL